MIPDLSLPLVIILLMGNSAFEPCFGNVALAVPKQTYWQGFECQTVHSQALQMPGISDGATLNVMEGLRFSVLRNQPRVSAAL